VLWPFLQIFDQDLLKWIQWFENVSKPIGITLESRNIKSSEEKSNREKIPISLTYTLCQITNLHQRPLWLVPLIVKLLYIKNKHN
jgi:hypothetical protein